MRYGFGSRSTKIAPFFRGAGDGKRRNAFRAVGGGGSNMNPLYRNDRYFITTREPRRNGAAPFAVGEAGASVSGRSWSVIGGGLGKKQKRGFRQGEKSGGVWTRWREKGRGVWAGCGEMFGFWRGAATAGVRDGGGCGRMRDGKCLFGAMISGGETWKGIFLRGGGCVL